MNNELARKNILLAKLSGAPIEIGNRRYLVAPCGGWTITEYVPSYNDYLPVYSGDSGLYDYTYAIVTDHDLCDIMVNHND